MLRSRRLKFWLLLFSSFVERASSYYCQGRFGTFPMERTAETTTRMMMTAASEEKSSENKDLSPRKHYTITVCMVPPPSETIVWEKVTQARTEFQDPGLYRWPPHVNMLYPFINIKSDRNSDETNAVVDESVIRRIRAASQQCEPFHVNLDSFGTFGGAGRGVLWLYPRSFRRNDDADEPLIRLQALLEEQFPTCTDQRKHGRYSPHMTLSHFPSLESARKAQAQVESWWPTELSFSMDRIYLLQRKGDDGQFLRIATIPLGDSMDDDGMRVHDPPEPFPLMPTTEEGWIRDEREKLKQRRNKSWKRGRRRGGRGSCKSNVQGDYRGPSRSRDSPEVIAAKRAERKAKRDRLEAERLEHSSGSSDIP